MDSNEYLRRFIDIEYSLPKPELKDYITYLLEVHKLNEFFSLDNRKANVLSEETDKFIRFSIFFFKLKGLTLRQQEKIIRHTGFALKSFNRNSFIIPQLLIYLIYLRLFHGELYSQIKNREFSHQKLINEIAKTLKGYLLANTVYDKRIDIEVYMLVYYNSYLEHEDKLKDLNSFEVMNDFKIKSNFDNSNTQDTFKRRVESEINHFHRSRISIDYLINKIDLMEPLKDYSNE